MEHKFPLSYATSSDLVKYDVQLYTGTRVFTGTIYSAYCHGVCLTAVEALPLPISIAIGLFAIFHCWVISGLQENKTWIRWLEPLRLASISAIVCHDPDTQRDYLAGSSVIHWCLTQSVVVYEETKKHNNF